VCDSCRQDSRGTFGKCCQPAFVGHVANRGKRGKTGGRPQEKLFVGPSFGQPSFISRCKTERTSAVRYRYFASRGFRVLIWNGAIGVIAPKPAAARCYPSGSTQACGQNPARTALRVMWSGQVIGRRHLGAGARASTTGSSAAVAHGHSHSISALRGMIPGGNQVAFNKGFIPLFLSSSQKVPHCRDRKPMQESKKPVSQRITNFGGGRSRNEPMVA